MPPTPRDRCATGWSTWAPRCSSNTSRASRRAQPEAQQGDETYAEKLGPEDFRVDPARPVGRARPRRAGRRSAAGRVGARRRSAVQAVRRDRVDRTRTGPPACIGAAGITTVDGTLHLREIQPEGKRRMAWDAWRRGHPDDLVIDA